MNEYNLEERGKCDSSIIKGTFKINNNIQKHSNIIKDLIKSFYDLKVFFQLFHVDVQKTKNRRRLMRHVSLHSSVEQINHKNEDGNSKGTLAHQYIFPPKQNRQKGK